ncbi:glycosyltransferase epsF [Salix suchowensis]|nr:glycosyltransferase epsF [Salix suchowensis]
MGLKYQACKTSSSSILFSVRYSTILTLAFLFTSCFLCISMLRYRQEPPVLSGEDTFNGDLRDVKFAWNKLCFGPSFEKLKLAVFSKTWPTGAGPGGMERHASTLYHALAGRGHEIHVFTAPSDGKPHLDIHEGNLHIFSRINENGEFDYVHTESVSLPHWRAKLVPNLAATWHGIWYEIMHSKLFEELYANPDGALPGPMTELQEAMPRLIDEIRFFSSYKQHVCISHSAGEVLVSVYQLPSRNVHVILNGVDTQICARSRCRSKAQKKIWCMACREYALSMFTADKMASAYERFFLCMKNSVYCQYPLSTDC